MASMNDVMRGQHAAARARLVRPAAQPPAPDARPAPASGGGAPPWTISPPGQAAPVHLFNHQPVGDGSWHIHPPGVHAPPWGPQASMPTMATHQQLRAMGGHMRRLFGGSAAVLPGSGAPPAPAGPPAPGPTTP